MREAYRQALSDCSKVRLHRGARISWTVGQRELITTSKLSINFFVLCFNHGVFGSIRSVKSIQRFVAHSSGVEGNVTLPSISPYMDVLCGTGV